MERIIRLSTMSLILVASPAIVIGVQVAYLVGEPILKIIDRLGDS